MRSIQNPSTRWLGRPRTEALWITRAWESRIEPRPTLDWAQFSAQLEAHRTGSSIPSAGTLLGMTALQAARACILDVHLEVGSTAFMEVMDTSHDLGETMAPLWQIPHEVAPIHALILIQSEQDNPATALFRDLYGVEYLAAGPLGQMAQRVESELKALEPEGPFDASLPDVLEAPCRAVPDSLSGQLRWVLDHWDAWLSEDIRTLLLGAVDRISEEVLARGGGPGPAHGPGLGDAYAGGFGAWGPARFSDDAAWMTNVVLIAKQTYVWLDQLSKAYDRPIHRLDEIPGEALDELAARGFTSLWLIGVWERSHASREIKRRRGNTEAEASAYSLYDYCVAERLGGEAALEHLRHLAWERGIRLAADMVPNHVGLDGKWMVDRPDWFLSVPHSPFPGYTFDGPNLSGDDRMGVYLEDGYWQETDAAVVFKRVDHQTGDTRYIYHGNDGTQMPWNDTAQLDYLNPEVREVVIGTILGVAKRFPVIRFDAAMTLASKHIERLWHPAPGSGGAIPSRAEYGVSPEALAAALPEEFWRDVVARVREEVPDTLLLAEAFWMMEGYFVRELGMHRVYNSAFMHMLRDEDNAKYRGVIREVLHSSPKILERFVNFMNNPDEDSAVDQFGKGDKYFGVVTLMATLPGLPMFGHGQIEGYAEKYGMEYARAYKNETPDEGLISHHERVLFPLLRARHLFASVTHFQLFDAERPEGGVDENVFAYTNRGQDGTGRALVAFNNAYDPTQVRLHRTMGVNVGEEDAPQIHACNLVEALGLPASSDTLIGLWELHSGKWFLRRSEQLRDEGLTLLMDGYGTQVFLSFREIVDTDGRWSSLCDALGGQGVQDLDAALHDHLTPPGPVWPDREVAFPKRGMGVLLHPSSLAGPEGIGTLGDAAHAFLDWLDEAGQSYWQVLPLCEAGAGFSPYSSSAGLLGNPLLVDLKKLVDAKLLKKGELPKSRPNASDRIDFKTVQAAKMPVLHQAAERLLETPDHPLHQRFLLWRAGQTHLEDSFLFKALQAMYPNRPWWTWPIGIRDRDVEALEGARTSLKDAISAHAAITFFFDLQWTELREAADARGITLMGDLPIYVSHDSADVWSNQSLFQLSPGGIPRRVAAVPPDAFSDTGQLWGNPLYDWDKMAEQAYAWWVERLGRVLEWTPMVRLDHFRGFEAYYSVAHGSEDATQGVWVKGPGRALFERFIEVFGHRPFVAEDLGEVDEKVFALRRGAGLLCTRVLQFGLAEPGEDSLHLPGNCPEDALVYTGTHDNDTTNGWFGTLDEASQARVKARVGGSDDVAFAITEIAAKTEAALVLVPVQDVLGLGSEGRMNIPGVADGNWGYRLTPGALKDTHAARLAKLARETGRG